MSAIQTLIDGMTRLAFRTAANSNFAALNADKAEKSALQYASKGLYNGTSTKTISGVQTAVSMVPTSGVWSLSLPAGFLNRVGKALRFRVAGYYSTDGGAGTWTLALKLGAADVASIGPINIDENVTNGGFYIDILVTARSTGVSGTVSVFSSVVYQQSNGDAKIAPMFTLSPVTVDLTAAQAADLVWTQTDAGSVVNVSTFAVWEEFQEA